MRWLRLIAALVVPAALLSAPANSQTNDPPAHLVGSLHNHSGYSDGWPENTPATYFAKGKANGLDFFGSGEHSDNAAVPVTAHEACLEDPTRCVHTDSDSFDKWNATQRQADEATDDTYTAFRGFEWTSDRFGHINVYFSRNDTNAKADGGYAVMDKFWKWLTTSPDLGGGADGVGTFNHPGADGEEVDPGFNWNDFAYIPGADSRMVGMEVYNDTAHFGAGRGPHPEGYYVHALDKGWHLGPVGAEDFHGDPGDEDDYGGRDYPKTVIISKDRSRASLREAMLARRFYALRRNDDGLRLSFEVDGRPMGSRITREPGAPIQIVAETNKTDVTVEVVTSGGAIVPAGSRVWDPAERYYFMRVKRGNEYVAYGSPVWITARDDRRWLAGDLHVHTCYSHDAYCGPADDNTGPDEFYTLSAPVEERFVEASTRGLDYLAITDHNDVRSVTDPGFGTHGVVGIPGYEKSLNGHAQMLGATKLYPRSTDVNVIAEALRADGGVFQINHPADGLSTRLDETCSDTSNLDWGYGFDVVPDTLEVWNIGHILQPPMPAGNSNDDSVRYWECWLDRGYRVGATGGSDSHWLSLSAVQGPGNPTTWVFANERTSESILRALDEGRTSISLVPPVFGAPRLVLEADADGDRTYEAVIGDDVPPGTTMRVRVENLPVGGRLEIRSTGGETLHDVTLLGGEAFTFDAPQTAGWVYAKLSGPDLRDERAQNCDPLVATLPLSDVGGEDGRTTYCRNAIVELALTSPIYLEEPAPDPVATSLTYTGPTTVSGELVDLAAHLATDDGTPVGGALITFTNRGTSVSATTDDSGNASTSMPFADHGRSQTVHIAYAGDERHLASEVSATLQWGQPKK